MSNFIILLWWHFYQNQKWKFYYCIEFYGLFQQIFQINVSDAATFVDVNIFVRSFSAIDDVKMVSIQIRLF